MITTLLMAGSAGAYAWYLLDPLFGVLVGIAMVTVVPKLLWYVVNRRLARLEEPTQEALITEMWIAKAMSWGSWLAIMALIAVTGGHI